MRKVFADTFYFLALLDSREERHREAAAASRDAQLQLATTTWVLDEIGDALASTRNRQWFPDSVADIASGPQIRVIPADEECFRRGVAFYRARPDKEWSLTDCLSFEVMRDLGIREALTSDQHFVQAGYRALLRERANNQPSAAANAPSASAPCSTSSPPSSTKPSRFCANNAGGCG